MTTMTVTDFSRNLRNVFDRIEHNGEEVILVRNNHKIARIIPGSSTLTAREAMNDLYRTIPEDSGEDWVKESRINNTLEKEKINQWDI